MAVFKNHSSEWLRLDWQILRDCSIRAYRTMAYLNDDIIWFEKEEYNVVRFNCSLWIDMSQMHHDLQEKLRLPDYYGGNYDALDECLEDFDIKDTGIVIVFERFDQLSKETRQTRLDTFYSAARFHLLMGKRMISLIHVEKSDTKFEAIKASEISWNSWQSNDIAES